MNKRKMKSRKGSVLIISILISFLLSITAISIYTIVYRYTNSITSRLEILRDEVYDNGQVLDDSVTDNVSGE